MTRNDLIAILERLSQNIHPLTGDRGPGDSCLREPRIQAELHRLVGRLQSGREQLISRQEIADTVDDLRDMGYDPTPRQIAKVMTGSRSIADPRLRGLLTYKRYRGLLTQRVIVSEIEKLKIRVPSYTSTETISSSTVDDWKLIDFFIMSQFDKLSEEKARELSREVKELGLRKEVDQLPEYMVRARRRLPRAFEPWTREEKALLIEAMCYTNDLDRLASLFGRSAASLERQGKQLIWASREKSAA
ncbi:MAG: hypothetical protein WA952_10400 [Lewinella sp.]